MTAKAIPPLLALLWCLCLAPIQSEIWNAERTPIWIVSLTPLHTLAAGVFAEFGQGLPRYDFFGRFFIVVYVGLLAGVWAMQLNSRSERIARRLLLIALIVAGAGDIVAYWIAGINNAPLRAIGFWAIEVPAIGFSILALSWIGVSLARQHIVTGYALAVTPLIALAATAALQYMPHGPVLSLALAVLIQVFGSPFSRFSKP